MITNELSWKNPENLNIFGRMWAPEGVVKGIIVLVHGIGEHIGRYEHVARMFTDHGYVLLGSDLPGHGKSGGQRGHANSFDDFFKQINWMVKQAQENYPGLPIFLYGHSLGANIVFSFLEQGLSPVKGAIITSPPLQVTRVPPLKLAVGKLMYRVFPRFTMTNSLDTSGLSHDPKIVEDYVHDPLVHPLVTARLGLDLINSSQLIINNRDKITVPLLLMHGSADHLVNVTGSREFVRQFQGNLTYVEIADGYHELHNEPDNQKVFKVWLDWLEPLTRPSDQSG